MPQKGRTIRDMGICENLAREDPDPSQNLSAEPFHNAGSFPGGRRVRDRRADVGSGKACQEGMSQSQGFKYFEKTDPDPRGHVSDMVERQGGSKAVHRVFPMVDAKIPSLTTGAASHPSDPQSAGNLRRQNARILESILKPAVIGVNPFKKGDLGLKSFILQEKGFDHGSGEAC